MPDRIAPPPPGIYPDIPMAEYHAWDAVSHSRLVPMLTSPQLCRAKMLQPEHETPAMILGRALHAMLLEPTTWKKDFAIGGPINPGTEKPYGRTSQKWAEWETGQDGKPVLTLDDVGEVQAWAMAVEHHEFASKLLGGKGRNELSLVWVDEPTGLTCRARVDRLAYDPGGYPSHIDIKTTIQQPAERNINRLVWDYGLDLQAAHYRAGAAALRPGERKFWFIFICKKPPHEIACLEMSAAWEEIGARRWRHALDRYAECLATDQWPGAIPTYMVLEPPLWAVRESGGEG